MEHQSHSSNPGKGLVNKVISKLGLRPERAGLLAVAAVAVMIVGVSLIISGRTGTDVSVADVFADLSLSPGAQTVNIGTKTTVSLRANTNAVLVDGIQVFLNITGTIPGDIKFIPADLSGSGLNRIISVIEDVNTGGKRLKLLFITSNPLAPYSSTQNVSIGSFEFTPSVAGSMQLTFDTTSTKITQNGTAVNVARYPSATTYTFQTATTPPTTPPPTTPPTTPPPTTPPTTPPPVTPPPPATVTGVLKVSTSSNRSGSVNASGYSAVAGTPLYVWLESNTIGPVEFYMNGQLFENEIYAPWDLKKTDTANEELAFPWNPTAGTYNIEAKFEGKTATATITITAPTTPPPTGGTGVACTLADVDGNNFLDIVDFANFAIKYGKICNPSTSTAQTDATGSTAPAFDYIVGETLNLPIKLFGVNGFHNATNVDLSITNATVTKFVATSGSGWLSPIGYCDAQGTPYTASRVCSAVSKTSAFIESETVGTLTLKLDNVGTVTVTKTAANIYSDGDTQVSKPGEVASFTVGTPTTPPPGETNLCGYQDGNNDTKINVIDLSQFARKYKKVNCQISF